eukprot:COSAG01_NODE_2404_length_7757_cov_3.497780_3_plen_585_part_00
MVFSDADITAAALRAGVYPSPPPTADPSAQQQAVAMQQYRQYVLQQQQMQQMQMQMQPQMQMQQPAHETRVQAVPQAADARQRTDAYMEEIQRQMHGVAVQPQPQPQQPQAPTQHTSPHQAQSAAAPRRPAGFRQTDSSVAASVLGFGTVPRGATSAAAPSLSHRYETPRQHNGVGDELCVVGGQFDPSIHKPTTAGPQPAPSEDWGAKRPAGAPAKRDGWSGTRWASLGRQTAAEVWTADTDADADGGPTATMMSSPGGGGLSGYGAPNRNYGRSAAHQQFFDQERAAITGGAWFGPSSSSAPPPRATPPSADGGGARSPAATPPDEAMTSPGATPPSSQWGRRKTPWHDTNDDNDFSILGGAWYAEQEAKSRRSRPLPSKPSAHQPPRSAYSDPPSTVASSGDGSDECSRPVSTRENNLGRDMAGCLGYGGGFDLRSSMAAPTWKPNRLTAADLLASTRGGAQGCDPSSENSPPPLSSSHARGRYQRSRREEEARLEADGLAMRDAMGTGGAFLGGGSAFRSEQDFSVALVGGSQRRRRPLSSKPSEMQLRQSQTLRNESALRERASALGENRRRHGGTVPW